MKVPDDALSPMGAVLAAYAGAGVDPHRAIWAFDARLAQVVRTTKETAIGQMRLAWWNDVLDDPGGSKGRGEPLVDALRATGVIGAEGLVAMIDGWEIVLVEPEMDAASLHAYAAGRGGGLFRALADTSDPPSWLNIAGQVWALWDLAGHVCDSALVGAALALASDLLPQAAAAQWPSAWKPLRIAFTMARQDVLAGCGAPTGMSRSHALRLLRIALVGR